MLISLWDESSDFSLCSPTLVYLSLVITILMTSHYRRLFTALLPLYLPKSHRDPRNNPTCSHDLSRNLPRRQAHTSRKTSSNLPNSPTVHRSLQTQCKTFPVWHQYCLLLVCWWPCVDESSIWAWRWTKPKSWLPVAQPQENYRNWSAKSLQSLNSCLSYYKCTESGLDEVCGKRGFVIVESVSLEIDDDVDSLHDSHGQK